MIAAIGCGLGIVLVLVTGGSLNRLAGVRVRFAPLAVCVFAVQGAARGRFPLVAERPGMALIVWTAAGLAIVAIVWANRTLPGAWLLGAGTGLNLMAVLLNAGMPVVAEGYSARLMAGVGFYHAARSSDVAILLADVLPVPGGWQMSVGDLLLLVGITIALVATAAGGDVRRSAQKS